MGEAAGEDLRRAAIGRHAVDIGAAHREREARQLTDVEVAVRAERHRRRDGVHRDGRAGRETQERRRGHVAVGEGRQRRDIA